MICSGTCTPEPMSWWGDGHLPEELRDPYILDSPVVKNVCQFLCHLCACALSLSLSHTQCAERNGAILAGILQEVGSAGI